MMQRFATIVLAALGGALAAQDPPTGVVRPPVGQDPARQDPTRQDPARQDPTRQGSPGTPSEAPQSPAELLASFERAGLRFDAKAGTVGLDVSVANPDNPLEFVLSHERGKVHEAMFVTRVKASQLNAALIALGCTPGENARVVDRDPMPTEEEVRNGAPMFDVIAPKGMTLWFTVRWTTLDEAGADVVHEHALEDLLLDLVVQKPVEDASWIYLGGNFAPIYRNEPPVFVGDFEGNLVSVVYKHPSNHLVTMSHARADDDQIWWFTETAPPPGTKVALTIHRAKPKLVAEREARIAKLRGEEPATSSGK